MLENKNGRLSLTKDQFHYTRKHQFNGGYQKLEQLEHIILNCFILTKKFIKLFIYLKIICL